eukprot:Skav219412  [mRNA]  locus=scaffold377:97500:103085:+ [translate_table: standard]
MHFEHEKAHDGHPWSEAVDSLAKAFAKGVFAPLHLPLEIPLILRNKGFAYAWLAHSSHVQAPFPYAFDGCFKAEGPFFENWSTPVDVTWKPSHAETATEDAIVDIKLATANVLTLEPGSTKQQQCGLMQHGRISTLQAQFRLAGCHIVGLQECRTTGEVTRHSGTHFVFQTGASSDGCRGCELWIDRALPYAATNGQEYLFQANQVHIASFSDRHLFALIRATHFQVRILVAHAPYSGASDCSCEQWWNIINDLVERNLNAHLGSSTSEAVSSHAAERENEAGHQVHAFLLENRLWAPATFESHHHGSSITWTSPKEGSHRLDYVILPLRWRHVTVHSWVMLEVDLATARQDHFAAAVHLQMIVPQSTRHFQKRCRLDARRCQDPAQVAQFQRYLDTMPVIPWEHGVGQHAEAITQWLQKGAAQCFASTKQMPRQRYMSDATWQVVLLRKQLLQIANQAVKHTHRVELKLVFCLWKSQLPRHAQTPLLRPFGIHPQQHIVEILRQLKLQCIKTEWWAVKARSILHGVARALSRQDRIQCAQSLLQTCHEAAFSHDTKRLYASLRPLLGQCGRKTFSGYRPIPALRHPTKGLIETAEAAAECWRDHFATPELGIAVSSFQLQQLAQIQSPRYDEDSLVLDMSSIPSLGQIEQLILRAKRGKSPGPDGLLSEIYQLNPAKFSILLWPLIVKTVIRCQEPMRWKGGEVVALPKCVQTGIVIDNFRSILLEDFASKISHGLLRQKLLPAYQQYRFSMQAGGVPRLSTDMLHLFVQSFAHICRSRQWSHGALFVDIKQAFYRACRPLLCFRHLSDCQIAQFFIQNGWSPSMFRAFQQQLHHPDALTQAHVTPHNRAQVQSILSSTWFQLRYAPETLTATASGTRPGDAVADLLFGFLMTRFIGRLREQFHAHGLHTSFELKWIPPGYLSQGDMPVQDIIQACWVDDLVLLLKHECPRQLLHQLQTAATITQSTAVEFAMQLNYGVNKTATVIHLRGKGVRTLWNDLLPPDGTLPSLTFECSAVSHPCALTIVPDYVYLGALQDLSGTPACEIKRRFLLLQATQRILNKNIFKSPRMPFSTKKQLFKSLVLSKLLYGAGSWQAMHIHTLRSWHTKVIKLYRSLVPHLPRKDGIYNLDVIAACQMPHPLMLLMMQRFSLYDRIMQTEATELFAVLQQQDPASSWFSLIRADLLHVAVLTPHMQLTTWADLCDDQQIAQHCLENPKALRKLGKQAFKVYEGYLKLWQQFRIFQQQFFEDVTCLGIQRFQTELPTTQSVTYTCHLCAATFSDYKSLCGHVFKKHGIANVAHRFAASNTCRGCLKKYNSREQVIHHLKYFKTGCLLKLTVSVPPLSDEELNEILSSERTDRSIQKKQQRTHHHRWPVVQSVGPQRPWPWQRILTQLRKDARQSLEYTDDEIHAWFSHVMQALHTGGIETTLVALRQFPYHGNLAQSIYDHVAQEIPGPRTAIDAEKWLVFQEAVEFWMHDSLVPTPHRESDVSFDNAQVSLASIRVPAVALQDQHMSHVDKRQQIVASMWADDDVVEQLRHQLDLEHRYRYVVSTSICRHICNSPVFLYVFSGRRRPGDVQTHLERYIAEFNLECHILLLDLALSSAHDVTNPQLIATLMFWMQNGYIAAVLTAPPCETWSQARYQLTDSPHDPRPVRSAKNPLCISGLKSAELVQVGVSNVLLFTALRLLFSAAVTGVPGILEHPLEPREPDRPSIWKLPWLKMMQDAGLIVRHNIQQARYGALAVKPTTLAVCNIPNFKTKMAQFTVAVDWANLELLTGRRSDGSWKTASAKEYPDKMNQAIAFSLASAHRHRVGLCTGFVAPDEFLQQVHTLYAGDIAFEDQRMQPDFGGQFQWDLMD